jgi:hypothetical protein
MKSWQDLKFPPNKTVYPKDGVSRARNIIVYRGDDIRLYILSAGFMVAVVSAAAIVFAVLYTNQGLRESRQLPSETDAIEDSDFDDIYDFDSSPVVFHAMNLILFSLITYVHLIHRRYIIRMYYDESKKLFTCVTYRTLIPWKTKSFAVKAGTAVLRPKLQSLPKFSWSCRLNGSKFNVHSHNFKYPVYFNVLFGFEDPNAISKLNDTDATAEEIFRERIKSKAD